MFEYTKDCEIGIDALDNDHKKMFEMIRKGTYLLENQYTLDKYDSIKALLDELLDYANTHFAREEAYMMKIRDPELILQRVQHDHFRKTIWDLDFKDIDTDEEQKEVLEKTLSFLAEWLYQHIIGSDSLIGKLEPLEEWMVKADPCAFTEEYTTGITFVDSEHKILFAITASLYQILKDGAEESDADEIINILQKLKAYTKVHFSDEEEYMESIGYEGLSAQKRAHQSFILELDDIDENEIHTNPQTYVKSLLEFLLGWLIQHILRADKLIPAQ